MKIRIKGNSIRVRLSRSEVDHFCATGHLEELTEFGNASFSYALQSREEDEAITAGFTDGRITMYVPAGIAREWGTNETVGYENHMDIGNGGQLFLLLEKDFKCIDAPPNEDQSDNFEHPKQAC